MGCIGYVVRADKGLIYVVINNSRMKAFIYPVENPNEKINLLVEINTQHPSDCGTLHIIDLIGNGDDSDYCGKGYGTELILSSFFVLNDHIKADFSFLEPSLVIVTGRLSPIGDIDKSSCERRSHFWSKFLTVEDCQNPCSYMNGTLQDILDKVGDVKVEKLQRPLPRRPTALEVVSQLSWSQEDSLAMEAVVQEFDANYYLIRQFYNQWPQNMLDKLLAFNNKCCERLPIVFSLGQRYELKRREQKRIHIEQKRIASIISIDSSRVGLMYRYFFNKCTEKGILTGLYVNGFMLNPRITIKQLKKILKINQS